MNYCFISGKIISDIDYKFMLEKKKYAKAKMIIELDSKNEVIIIAYNKMADYIYRKMRNNMYIIIEGKIVKDMVEAIRICNI